MQRFTIEDNYSISRILKGGWQLAGGHGQIDETEAIEDMAKYVEAGITTFDCADIYTGVEELIGRFLKKSGKKIPEDIQIHTKYVPDLAGLTTVTPKDTEDIIDRSLLRLGIERLNVVQFHWWDYDVPRYVETALTLTKLQKKGKIQFVSVTNFDVERLQELVEAGVKITTTQNQYSVIDNRPENGLINFCKEHGIKLLCYGTAAGGFVSERYLGQPEPQEPQENRSLTKYKLIIDDFGGWELFQELLVALHIIAKKHNVSITNVATRYILEKPLVAGAIIGARNAKHLDDNLRVFGFDLEANDIESINKVLKKSKGLEGDVYYLERIKGGRHAGIMKYNLNKV